MDFNKLSDAEKRLVLLVGAVILGGLAGVSDGWGFGATIGLLAGIAIGAVIFQPQLMPAMKLPIAKSQLVFYLSLVTAAGFILSAISFLSSVFGFGNITTILFDIGLVASIALAWLSWLDFKVANPEMAAKIVAAMPKQGDDAAAAAPAAPAAPMAAAKAPEPKPMAAPEPKPMAAPEPEPMAAPEPMAEAEPMPEAASEPAADEPADEEPTAG